MTPFGMVCRKCGAGMPTGVRFCGKCGASFDDRAAPPRQESRSGKRPGARALLSIWALGLLAGFMLGRAVPDPSVSPPERKTIAETGNAETLISQAQAAFDAKQYPKAIDLYRKAIPLRTSDLGLLVDLGIAHAATGDEAMARASFKSALIGSSPHPAAVYNLALLAERGGKAERSRAYYRRYLELDPEGSRAEQARAKLAEGER